MKTADDGLNFMDRLSTLALGVTSEQKMAFNSGKDCPAGGMLAGLQLTEEEVVIQVAFGQFKEDYLRQRRAYERLTPSDQKSVAYANLTALYQDCARTVDCFWLSVKSRLPKGSGLYREIGYNKNLELWFGPEIRRELDCLPTSFDQVCKRI
jgi:hypothetical protein